MDPNQMARARVATATAIAGLELRRPKGPPYVRLSSWLRCSGASRALCQLWVSTRPAPWSCGLRAPLGLLASHLGTAGSPLNAPPGVRGAVCLGLRVAG